MSSSSALKDIAEALPVFGSREQKEKFLLAIGALTARMISLKKAAELMNLDSEALLQILNGLGIDFSYLSAEDIEREREW